MLLYLITSVVFVICVIFSFSNTWTAIKKNKALSRQNLNNSPSYQSYGEIKLKYNKLDTLIKLYTVDSVQFETNFLSNISLAIQDLPIQLNYDENSKKDKSDSIIKSNSFTLTGDYKEIIRAIDKLEKVFFISRIEYNNGAYSIEITFSSKNSG